MDYQSQLALELELQNDELLKTSHELQEARAKYVDYYENAPVGYLIVNTAGAIVDVNLTAASLLGAIRSRIIGQPITRFIHTDDQDAYYLFHNSIAISPSRRELELRMTNTHGGIAWVRMDAAVETGRGDAQYRIMLTNITAQKDGEEFLRTNLEQHQSIIDTAIDGFWIADTNGRLLEVNKTYCAMSGYSEQELLTMSIADLNAHKTEVEFEAHARRIIALGEERFEAVHRRKDGSVYDVEVSVQYQPVGEGRFVVFLRNISEKLRLERELREWASLISTIEVGIASGDADGLSFKIMNAAFARVHGYTIEEMRTKAAIDIIAPAWVRHEHDNFTLVKDRGHHIFGSYHLRKDGSLFPVKIDATAVKDDHGNILYLVASVDDITEANEIDRLLRVSEDRFKKAFMTSPDSININRLTDGMYVSVNPGFTQILGYTEADSIGKTSLELNIWWDPNDRKRFVERLVAERVVQNFEAPFRAKNGGVVYGSMSASIIELEGTDHIINITRDITERKLIEDRLRGMEETLRQSEKMDAIGHLAGGIAHDFNNILGGIIGFTDMSLAYAEPQSVLERNLRNVLTAADRAAKLVQQILTFSRRNSTQISSVYLRPILKEVLALLRASIPSSVTIRSDLHQDVKPILADPTKIHEAVLNLATNAVHAMKGKGRLTVRLAAEHLTEAKLCRSGELPPGEYAVIEVADTGCGMNPDTLAKAFDPFFTTKPPGEGTGMGLSVVLGVVASCGGDICIETAVGTGTTIRIILPVTDEKPFGTTGIVEQTHTTGSERVLFVDDEPMLVDVTVAWLTSLGYTVAGFTNSSEALRFFREHVDEVDILITDHTMPGMNGNELAETVLALRGDLPIILCTGFSNDMNAEKAAAIGISQFLMKPYRPRDISVLLRKVLDGKVTY